MELDKRCFYDFGSEPVAELHRITMLEAELRLVLAQRTSDTARAKLRAERAKAEWEPNDAQQAYISAGTTAAERDERRKNCRELSIHAFKVAEVDDQEQEAIVEASHAFSRHLLDMAFLVASEAQR